MFSRSTLLGRRGNNDGYEMSTKRQRLLDSGSYFGSPTSLLYGASALSSSYLPQARSFPVVRLRGLPFNCVESDVLEFFAGLDVVDVVLIHKQGRFSGEAYVVFGASIQVDLALQKNRQNIGRRYVEIFRSKKLDYYHAVAAELVDPKSANGQSGPRTPPPPRRKSSPDRNREQEYTVLKLRGLPFSTSKRDILDFFNEYDLADENVHIVVHSDGRATGEAYVEFCSSGDAKAAMRKDKMTMGNRYVELFPSSREEAVRAAAKSR